MVCSTTFKKPALCPCVLCTEGRRVTVHRKSVVPTLRVLRGLGTCFILISGRKTYTGLRGRKESTDLLGWKAYHIDLLKTQYCFTDKILIYWKTYQDLFTGRHIILTYNIDYFTGRI